MRSIGHAHRAGLRRSLAIVVAGALALAACGGDDDDTDSDSTGPDDTEATSDTGEPGDTTGETSDDSPTPSGESVVVGAVLEPTSLDILTVAGAALDQILLDNVYETLLTTDADGEIVGGLAELPDVSEDAMTFTFAIAEGVTFHDGDPLTASDVVWSLEQAGNPETGPSADDLSSVESITAPDEHTVELVLTQPDNNLLFNMTRRAGAVLNEGASGLGDSANGTGPFVFDEWIKGSSISLTTNPDYWGSAPAIGGVTFQYFTDANAAVNALTTGDVDILTGVNTELVAPLEDNPDFVVNQGTTNGEFTLGMNNADEALSNHDVRLAIRQAIDKEGVLELYNGYGTIIGGPVPPTDPWYEDLTDTAPYDPDAARELLEGAGYGDGLELTFVVPNIYPTSASEFVASELAEVGIDVEIQPVEFSVWLEQVYTNHDYDLTLVLHVEPRDISNYARDDYYWNYDSADVQQLIADAQVAPDPDEATDLLRQAARQIAEDSPVDWLLLYADLTVARTGVEGYPVNDTASRFDASGITVAG